MKKLIYLVVVLSIVACVIQAQPRPNPQRPRGPNFGFMNPNTSWSPVQQRPQGKKLEQATSTLTPNSQNQTGGLIIPNNPSSTGINKRPSDSKPGTIPLR
jgi:hypothetical protein